MSVEQSLRRASRHAKKSEISLAADQYKRILDKYPKNKRAIAGLRELQQPITATGGNTSQEQIRELISLYGQGNFQQV